MTPRLLAVALAASAVMQPPSQTQTTIRSGIDLLRLNVVALDDKGQPVRDLGAADFVVEVDGKPRTVSFAKFYGPDAARAPGAAAAVIPAPASFATNLGAPPGRVILLVVDVESMHPGYEKLILDTGRRPMPAARPATGRPW